MLKCKKYFQNFEGGEIYEKDFCFGDFFTGKRFYFGSDERTYFFGIVTQQLLENISF